MRVAFVLHSAYFPRLTASERLTQMRGHIRRFVCFAILLTSSLTLAADDNATDIEKKINGIWRVESTKLDGKEDPDKVTVPWFKQGSVWKFNRDGTGTMGPAWSKWKYDADDKMLTVSHVNIFGSEVSKIDYKLKLLGEKMQLKFYGDSVEIITVLVRPED
jgi:hypothetical protein